MENQQNQLDEKIKAEKEALEKLEAEKLEAEKLKAVTRKVLTLDEELAIMKKDQERNMKAHAEMLKKQSAPKHPEKKIELGK